MVPDKTIELSGGVTATVAEIDVTIGCKLLAALDASGSGLDELIFVETEQLMTLVGNKISLELVEPTNGPIRLTYSDLDAIAVAFVEVNKSFLARTLKQRGAKAPLAEALQTA